MEGCSPHHDRAGIPPLPEYNTHYITMHIPKICEGRGIPCGYLLSSGKVVQILLPGNPLVVGNTTVKERDTGCVFTLSECL